MMPLDAMYMLLLIGKMGVTAAFVVGATVTAERAGPLVGGLVSTLPISAGPVYVFLALDHDAQFLADSAVATLAINVANAIFAMSYAVLAQRRPLALSLAPAFGIWLVLAWIIHLVKWDLWSALLLNIATLGVCIRIARPYRKVAAPRVRARWHELALRAAAVALLAGGIVMFSFRIGPAASGILAVFPIVLISVIVIMHRRVGGKASAAVLANAVLGLVGFIFACAALHFAAVPMGAAAALLVALSASIGWGLLVYAARMRGVPV